MTKDFRRFWASQTISVIGTQVREIALPLAAITLLHASAAQMGWLVAMRHLPMAVLGLAAGVWVDRLRRRPIMVVADLSRALLVGSVPVAFLVFDRLSMMHLYAVALGTGAFKVVYAVADRAYLPTLLPRDQLVAANSRIFFSFSFARTVGPGLGGLLVKLATAPLALLIDAFSFLLSGVLLLFIRKAEAPPRSKTSVPMVAGIREGLGRVWRDPLLRPLVLCGGTHNICSTAIVALYFLYLSRYLGFSAAVLGTVLLVGGAGAILGSMVAGRLARRRGIGPTLIVAQVFSGIARLLVPLAAGPSPWALVVLAVSELMLGTMRAIFNITQISLRQAITADAWQGRVNGTIGFLLWVLTPLGALAGGYLGDAFGLRPTLFGAALGVTASTLWMWRSPLRTYRG